MARKVTTKRKGKAKTAKVTAAAEPVSPKLYKVLLDGRSFNGGRHQWSLPADGQPGDWHENAGELVMCSVGFHLTTKPAKWFVRGAKVFLAEADKVGDQKDDKVVCGRVRLLREITADEYAAQNIFFDGEHTVAGTDTVAWALGSSRVTASDSSWVTAYDSSQVTAYGSSQVTAYGSSRVTAYGESDVRLLSSVAKVDLSGNAVLVDRTDHGKKPAIRFGAESKQSA